MLSLFLGDLPPENAAGFYDPINTIFIFIFAADRNELMKERVHLEKAAKNNAKEDSRAQQKRKDPEDSTDGQKKKKQKKGKRKKRRRNRIRRGKNIF